VAVAEGLDGARRVLVYGVTGCGKSTLAAQIAAATDLPFHPVDDLMWEPGWVAVDIDEQRRRIAHVCAQPAWVIDAAYGSWIDVPLARVELIVALDYPRWLSFGRLLRRSVERIVRKTAVCNGNVETLRATLARDSILLWNITSFARKRQRMDRWASDPASPRLVRFTRSQQADDWLAMLRVSANGT
jgi:adenylate kinase family enzyme